VWIEVAVPEVIDRASGASHYESSCEEEGCCADDRGWCGERCGHGCSEKCAEHARKEEIVCTGWFVQPHQLAIGNSFLRQI